MLGTSHLKSKAYVDSVHAKREKLFLSTKLAELPHTMTKEELRKLAGYGIRPPSTQRPILEEADEDGGSIASRFARRSAARKRLSEMDLNDDDLLSQVSHVSGAVSA